jgi:hypothetical protein
LVDKQGSFVEGHNTPEMELMGKPQVLSFWELLIVFAWYIFEGFVLQVVGRYREQELDWGKLKKARLLQMERVLIKSICKIWKRVTYMMSIYVCFFLVVVWKSRDGRVLVYMCKFSPLFSKLLNFLMFQSPHTYSKKKKKRTQVAKSLHLDKTMVANYMTTLKI